MTSPRARLLELLTERAVVHEHIQLSSGGSADVYLDLRRLSLDGEAAPLLGQVMLDLVADLDVDAVGGLTMGADPVATAMLHAAATRGRTLDAFVVRKTAKEHGTGRRIEGPGVAGRRVVALEDTSTTGASVLAAVEALREAGAQVVAVAILADRGAGAREAIEAAGLPFRAAYGPDELPI